MPTSDFSEFCDFLNQLRVRGPGNLTPEQSVHEFREQQEKLRVWNDRNAESIAQAAQGEAKPLDIDALMNRVTRRLTQHKAAE